MIVWLFWRSISGLSNLFSRRATFRVSYLLYHEFPVHNLISCAFPWYRTSLFISKFFLQYYLYFLCYYFKMILLAWQIIATVLLFAHFIASPFLVRVTNKDNNQSSGHSDCIMQSLRIKFYNLINMLKKKEIICKFNSFKAIKSMFSSFSLTVLWFWHRIWNSVPEHTPSKW